VAWCLVFGAWLWEFFRIRFFLDLPFGRANDTSAPWCFCVERRLSSSSSSSSSSSFFNGFYSLVFAFSGIF